MPPKNFSSTFDGTSWSTPSIEISNNGNPSNTIIAAYNPNLEKVVACWSDSMLQVNYSLYDGTTWSAPQLIPGGTGVFVSFPSYNNGIGKTIVTFPDPSMTMLGYSSIFDGANWSIPEQIPGVTNAVVISSSYNPILGATVATWDDQMTAQTYSSLFDGIQWSPTPIPISGNVNFPNILTTFDPTQNRTMAVWSDMTSHTAYFSFFENGAWSSPAEIPGTSVFNAVYPLYNPVLNKIVATWTDLTTNQGYYSFFDGTSWSSPELIPGCFSGSVITVFDRELGKMLGTWADFTTQQNYSSLFYIPSIPFSGTGNLAKIANYLNQVGQSAALRPIMALLIGLSPDQLTTAYASLSNARNAFMPWVTGSTALSLNQIMENRCAELRELTHTKPSSPSTEITALMAAQELPQGSVQAAARKDQPYALWAEGLGNFSHQKAQDQNPAFNANTGGGILGADYYGKNLRLAGSAAYAHSSVKESTHAGYSDIDSYFASFFASGSLYNGYLEAGVSGLYNRYHSNRHITFPDFNAHAKASFSGWQVVPHLSLGYDFLVSDWVIEPFGSADCSILFLDGFSEQGAAPLNMKQPSATSELLQVRGGVRTYFSGSPSWGLWFFEMTAAYLYKKGWGVGTITNASIVDQPSGFTVTSLDGAQNCFAPRVEFFVRTNNGFFTSCSYSGEFAEKFMTNSLMAKIGSFF